MEVIEVFIKNNLLNKDNVMKIKIKNFLWEDLFEDKTILYSALCDLLLNEENLLYYATQKDSSKTMIDTKRYVKALIDNGSLIYIVDDIFNSLGWNRDINIENTIFQGDLAEYLMSILLDKITNVETMISKISYKTSPSMPIYGNDNVYYDYENDILYFGESKFYKNAKDGLNAAVESIKKHSNIEEISFVRNHTSSFIAENGEKRYRVIEKFENAYTNEINIKSIIFIINDDIYTKKDYEDVLVNYYGTIDEVTIKTSEIILVFLPILSKKDFLEYFVRRVNND